MVQRSVAVCLVLGVILTGASLAAQSANPTQQTTTTRDGQTPVFRVTVVGRSVPAVNYRPRDGDTRINFEGTALLPEAKGWAEISGEKGYVKIDARFEDLDRAGRFGREYLTYVLWAITPEGRATNLGELQVNGDDGRLEVTTELQSFALVVTAEPYFAVSQPSDVVVLENAVRRTGFEATKGRVETVQASYELLKRGTYLMNRDPASVRIETPKPGERSDLAQGRNAVEFARLAGADRYATETFRKAETLLAEAESARERRRSGNQVMQPARQAAQTAEDARLIALQRQEDEFLAEQKRLAQEREEEARRLARLEEERRRQAEQDRLRAEELRLQAERERALSDAARQAAERERLEAERAKAEADRARADAERVRGEAEAARLAAEQQAQQARQSAEQAEREREELRNRLREQLNVILETRETARGLIVNVSDVLFDFDRADLKPGARERLARVAGILSSHPTLKIEIEGHTDAVGSDNYNQGLSERRAASVSSYLRGQGIGQAIVSTQGFGESRPVATNGTAEGRQQNRRVEIVVSGEAIGR